MAAYSLGDALNMSANPFKGRQSLGANPEKENTARTKHKRAQSLGGDALGSQYMLNQGTRRASEEADILSPRKKARRSLVC